MKRYSLGIVQTHATQFDAPLYSRIYKHKEVELRVYYTRPIRGTPFDPEIGLRPNWGTPKRYRSLTRQRGVINAIRFARNIISARHNLIIISGYSPLYHLAVALYARLAGVPVGLRSDTTLETARGGIKSFIKRCVMPTVLRLYQTGHPTGFRARQYLVYYGLAEDRQFSFPYTVDNNYLDSRSRRYRSRRDRLRRAIGIPPGSFVVLGVLKLIPREDPLTLLLGFAKLVKSCASVHLVLVGDGPMRKKIEATIKDKGIANVHLQGYVRYSHLPLFYAIADLFVHPPLREPWGVSVNEAMACGLPVVVADAVGSHEDLVVPGNTGFVFKTGDPESLSSYLLLISQDRELCRSIGQNARALIANFSYESTEQSLIEGLKVIAPGESAQTETLLAE